MLMKLLKFYKNDTKIKMIKNSRMEEDNPWTEAIPHVNKKSVKPDTQIIKHVVQNNNKHKQKTHHKRRVEVTKVEVTKVEDPNVNITVKDSVNNESDVDPDVALKIPINAPINVSPDVSSNPSVKDEKPDYLTVLVEDSFLSLNKKAEIWVLEHFDADWLKDFMSQLEDVKQDILTSKFNPDIKTMILLKYIFLLQKGF